MVQEPIGDLQRGREPRKGLDRGRQEGEDQLWGKKEDKGPLRKGIGKGALRQERTEGLGRGNMAIGRSLLKRKRVKEK